MPKQSLTLLAASVLLAACSTQAPPVAMSADDQARAYFVQASQRVLTRLAREANPHWQTGSLEVVYTLDQHDQVLDCRTRPVGSPEKSAGLPYNPQLAQALANLCWQAVLPALPAHLRDPGETSEVVAPLLFPAYQVDAGRLARQAAISQRSAFFWHHLFADETLDSIGTARLIGVLDERRDVIGCTVIIEPHPLRRRAFKQDNALLDRLGHGCAQLRDVPTIPGARPNAEGRQVFIVNLDYSPWRYKAGARP